MRTFASLNSGSCLLVKSHFTFLKEVLGVTLCIHHDRLLLVPQRLDPAIAYECVRASAAGNQAQTEANDMPMTVSMQAPAMHPEPIGISVVVAKVLQD